MKIRIPFSSISKPVKALEDSVNTTMSEFGFHEKMQITTVIPMTITASEPMTKEQIELLKNMTVEHYTEAFGSASIESFEVIV